MKWLIILFLFVPGIARPDVYTINHIMDRLNEIMNDRQELNNA